MLIHDTDAFYFRTAHVVCSVQDKYTPLSVNVIFALYVRG